MGERLWYDRVAEGTAVYKAARGRGGELGFRIAALVVAGDREGLRRALTKLTDHADRRLRAKIERLLE